MNHPLQRRVVALLFLGLVTQFSPAMAEVYGGDTPPPPRAYPAPDSAPVYVVPPPPPEPPPLSPAMKVIYAPFYGAGLVIRYGLYYGLVAPLEVFGRALSYGVSGGVDHSERVE